jgi:hypothetical protein
MIDKKKIFCIEGDWDINLKNKKSILNVLDFLKNVYNVDYIHKNCATKTEFIYRLEQFKKYSSFKILYLAFHGTSKKIHFESNETIDLLEIQKILSKSLNDKIIYFGCCKTLKVKDSFLDAFILETHATCIVGFDKDADFFDGSIIDLLFFETVQFYDFENIKKLKKDFEKLHINFCKKYGFKIHTR